MRVNLLITFLSFTCIHLMVGCKQDLEAPEPFSGDIRFTNFASFGDGYVAGYTNEGLSAVDQLTSFPSLISIQLSIISPISFNQALIDAPGSGHLIFEQLEDSTCPKLPSRAILSTAAPLPNWNKNVAGQGPFSNLGIPNLRLMEITDSTLSHNNPFFNRLLEDSDESYMSFIGDQATDFFVLWLGTEDLLEAGVSGGQSIEKLPTQEEFQIQIESLLARVTDLDPSVRGLVANLPYVFEMPYFHHVPHQYVDPETCDKAISPIYITQGEGNNFEVRAATENDFILLPADSLIGRSVSGNANWGLIQANPIPDSLVLDEDEAFQLRIQTDIYNNAIHSALLQQNVESGIQRLTLVNLNRELSAIHNGVILAGLEISSTYLTGEVYSLDGRYLTPRGNAIIANAFIRQANEAFGARIPTINITDYAGVAFP